MFYRFKGTRGFEKLEVKTLFAFLKGNTTTSGKLTVPFEIVLPGMLDKGVDGEDNFIPWVFSSYDCDRYDERVDPVGWDLSAFNENPVVLWAHCHSIPAIGVAQNLNCADKLCGSIRFNAKEYDEFGWSIGERVKNGVIRAGSVGMLVKEVEWIDHKKNPDEVCELIIRKQELLEFSICNVPANPFALQKGSLGEFSEAEFSTSGELRTSSVRKGSLGEFSEAVFSTSGGIKKNGGDIAPTNISLTDATCGFMPYLTKKVDGGSDGRRIAPCA